MTSDWAYYALVPVAGLEFTIVGLAVALSVIRWHHGLVPLRCHNYKGCRPPPRAVGGPSDEDANLVIGLRAEIAMATRFL
jgi:hypothetical protein